MSKLLSKAQNIKDLQIKSRLDSLRGFNNNNNNSNKNDNFQPPPEPLPQPPPQPLRRNDIFQPSQTPRQNYLFNPAPQIPATTSTPPLPPEHLFLSDSPPFTVSDYLNLPEVPSFTFNNFAPRQNSRGRNVTQSTDGQNLIGQLERVIEKSEKKSEKFEVDASISTYFNDTEEILKGKYLEKD